MGFNEGIKLLNRIKIGAIHYIIERCALGDHGNIVFGRAKISISDELSQEKSEETVFHEVVECWNELYELKLPHNKIQIIGVALHQLVKDNDLSSIYGGEQ